MLLNIAVLSAGLVIALLGFLLRRKLRGGWTISFLVTGLLLTCLGGWFLRGQLLQDREKKEAVYISLRYLERHETESAAFYLKNAGSAEDFETASARYLLERFRNNDITAHLNLDIARSKARSDEKNNFLLTLQALDTNDSQQLALVTERIIGFLNLPEKRRDALDYHVQAEGGGSWSQMGNPDSGIDETAASRLRISSMLGNGSYEGAVAAAVELVDRKPNVDNRLLLAGAVAESAYNGVILSNNVFAASDEKGVKEDASAQREREKLAERRERVSTELREVEIAVNAAADEGTLRSLNEKKLELTEEIQSLQTRSDKLYVYRAFNAISDIHTLEAELVRARLYFALQEYEQAVDAIRGSANSIAAKLTTNRGLANNLRIVEEAYAGSAVFHDSQEFRDAVTQLLSAPFSDLMYLSQTALTRDFTQRIISDQKTYGRSLFVSGIDTDDYPVVRVSISGREDILSQVVEQRKVTVRDTRQDVSFTGEIEATYLSNICIVVDRSGSMDGTPMENLKDALRDFAEDMKENTAVSLVAFDNYAQQLTDLSSDPVLLRSSVDTLQASGGTDIGEGIRCGNEILTPASGNRVMLLMTDGQSGLDFSVVEDAAAAGIVIHTIGFGSVNDSLLQQIADQTGGQYIRADSSTELSNVYASLQQVIGNIATLEYTVTNPEVTERYVFIQTENVSVHRDYSLTSDRNFVQLYTCSPPVLDPSDLRQVAELNMQLVLSFTGEGLTKVASVNIGGQDAEITSQDDTSLRVAFVPSSSAGWVKVTLRMTNGTEQSFDRLLLVGQYDYYRNLRLGSLVIASASGVLPGDGTLVLMGSNVELQENVSPDSTLSLYLNGALILPWPGAAAGNDAAGDGARTPDTYSDLDLGERGTASGWGIVTLGYNDGAYTNNAPNIVASGGLLLECEPTQTRLIQQEGGAANE